jgi:hypothetical protein
LKGRSPAEVVDAWALENKIRMVPDVDLLGFLLSEPMPKTVQKGGIEHNKRKYIAGELCPGKRVEIRDSPEDAGRVAVFGADGAFLCLAVDAEMEGIDRAAIAVRARERQKAANAAVREAAREAKRLARPAAVAREMLDARPASNVTALQRPDYSGGTAEMAAAIAAGAADALAARAMRADAPLAGGAAHVRPHAMDAAAMDAAARMFDDADALAETPEARFMRLLRGGEFGPSDREFFDYYSQLPTGRGMRLAAETA